MIEVYALVSKVNGNIYIGMALNAQNRLKEHNSGKSRYTKSFRPWNLFRIENFPNWKEARAREKYLKSGIGKEFLKSLVP